MCMEFGRNIKFHFIPRCVFIASLILFIIWFIIVIISYVFFFISFCLFFCWSAVGVCWSLLEWCLLVCWSCWSVGAPYSNSVGGFFGDSNKNALQKIAENKHFTISLTRFCWSVGVLEWKNRNFFENTNFSQNRVFCA